MDEPQESEHKIEHRICRIEVRDCRHCRGKWFTYIWEHIPERICAVCAYCAAKFAEAEEAPEKRLLH